jgi:hypothetical protein
MNSGEIMETDTREERIKKERIRFRKKMKEEKYNEALYSFFNGDTVGG